MSLQLKVAAAAGIALLAGSTFLGAENGASFRQSSAPGVSPDGIRHDALRELVESATVEAETESDLLSLFFRSIDGKDNNFLHPFWGAAQTHLLRKAPAAYADGHGTPAGPNRISARAISNICNRQDASSPNAVGASDYLWQWGQFLDHDMDLSELANPAEPFAIDVPLGDPFFDPSSAGSQLIGMDRSHYVVIRGVRQQVNSITSFIDASNVYGSNAARSMALRTLDGTGRLKTSIGGLLPLNADGFPNAGGTDASLFFAGDVRANEQVGLTAMHTLFVREHNFWANALATVDSTLSDEELYQTARAIVGAEMQAITYREFLPLLLGPDALPPYRGYRPNVNPAIANGFSTAAYRVGHTMLSSQLLRLNAEGEEIPEGHLSLADSFFRPDHIQQVGIDPVLRGLAAQAAQSIDPNLIDEVRNFLFGPPGAGGFDLASLNIQRGRDHGLATYNRFRRAFGLPVVTSFAQINSDPVVQAALSEAYGSVNQIDLWVGGLSEPPVPGAMVGATFFAILKDQFLRLRDGDRFFYRNHLPGGLADLVEEQTLARIIRRNSGIGNEIQDDVFRLPSQSAASQFEVLSSH